ncbi:putative selenate ABC transporter substrate-binding protein [Microbulbifer hydrolyticus]|uniref:Phosphonate transport system substrate-binding protein n=1 Tax=Microbulbifer hydrolyticus TaxID=48074 RepID=A0A6P1TA56_9GAMM|nr:putative selenate ABC transporter substrate-binding protein [Microbulbifer hydrolyticus]MBB5213231.1 phosphonate transport system substrate-binding protein [Microbulbifer hydrolyticus]QHQ38506.1 putative selenate ABC transporter substrate-binding protein [Microbulbifer hydrolyticus]
MIHRAISGTRALAALCLLPVIFLSSVVAVANDATAEDPSPKVLRVSAIPDEAPTELLRKFKPLGSYLEQQLGLKVQFIPVTDYAAVVESLAADRVDLAWLGGFTFVQARLRTGDAIPLVQREQDRRFTSKFITADPAIQSLQDLKGKSFVFGSISSTSGSLMPRYFLAQDKIVPEDFFSRVAYSGAHDATAAWVQAGKADAGVLNASVWEKLVAAGKVDTDKVRVLATTPPYFDYNWTVRGGLDTALVAKIKQSFLALDPANPQHKTILDLQAADRFIETSPENYRSIEDAARSVGLLK